MQYLYDVKRLGDCVLIESIKDAVTELSNKIKDKGNIYGELFSTFVIRDVLFTSSASRITSIYKASSIIEIYDVYMDPYDKNIVICFNLREDSTMTDEVSIKTIERLINNGTSVISPRIYVNEEEIGKFVYRIITFDVILNNN